MVTHCSEPRVKFGITSGDSRLRLRVHHKAGYKCVEYLAAGLAEGVALDTENAVKSALALADEEPVHGKDTSTFPACP